MASNRNTDDDHMSESETSTADAESADDEPSKNVDASSAADTPPSAAQRCGSMMRSSDPRSQGLGFRV